jgi:shikimate dehydrogenase
LVATLWDRRRLCAAAGPARTLGSALRALADLGFAGCNLTVPHKEAALGALDEVAEDARRIGAVNTILVRADGSLYGWNTDIEGFAQSLIAALPEWSIAGKHAVVLGAGGAATGGGGGCAESRC